MGKRIKPGMSDEEVFKLVPQMWCDLSNARLSPELVGIDYLTFVRLAREKMHE